MIGRHLVPMICGSGYAGGSRGGQVGASISAGAPHSAGRSHLPSAACSRLPRREPVPAGHTPSSAISVGDLVSAM